MTDEHYTVASNMGNFSKWVRERIEEHIQKQKKAIDQQITYVCSKCVGGEPYEFQRGPVNDRLRGWRYPPHMMCPICENEATRWDC